MAEAPVALEVFDFIDTFSEENSIWSVAFANMVNARPRAIFRFVYPGVLGVSVMLALIYAL